jgi:hypothetical protein
MFAHGFGIGGAPAIIDADILPDCPTGLLQGLSESRQPGMSLRIVRRKGREDADAPHLLALLRARRERPAG